MLGKVLFRYIYVHMKRLELHPITYGIPSLQYTMNGRLASSRYSRGHSQIPHRMVQYVQNTVAESLLGGSGTFVSQSPSPSPPTPRPPGKEIPSETIHSDDLIAKCLD